MCVCMCMVGWGWRIEKGPIDESDLNVLSMITNHDLPKIWTQISTLAKHISLCLEL